MYCICSCPRIPAFGSVDIICYIAFVLITGLPWFTYRIRVYQKIAKPWEEAIHYHQKLPTTVHVVVELSSPFPLADLVSWVHTCWGAGLAPPSLLLPALWRRTGGEAVPPQWGAAILPVLLWDNVRHCVWGKQSGKEKGMTLYLIDVNDTNFRDG